MFSYLSSSTLLCIMSYTIADELPIGPTDKDLAVRWAAVRRDIQAQLRLWRPHARVLPEILAYATARTHDACEKRDDGSELHATIPEVLAAVKRARRSGARELFFLAECFNKPGSPTTANRHARVSDGRTIVTPAEIHLYACRLRYRKGGAKLDVWDSSGRQRGRRGCRRDLAPNLIRRLIRPPYSHHQAHI